jgi:hypothetical protein
VITIYVILSWDSNDDPEPPEAVEAFVDLHEAKKRMDYLIKTNEEDSKRYDEGMINFHRWLSKNVYSTWENPNPKPMSEEQYQEWQLKWAGEPCYPISYHLVAVSCGI